MIDGVVMEMSDSMQKLLDTLISLYYQIHPEAEKISTTVVLTADLNKSHGELRPDMVDRLSDETIESDYNGRMVVPHLVGDPISILLSTTKMMEYTNDGSMTWVGTFAHELTHAIDYHQMAVKEGLKFYDILEKTDQYRMFQLWSEYHARRCGYAFLRKYFELVGKMPDTFQQLDHIMNTEWPFHMKRHYNEYHMNSDGSNQMYITMQLFGRYSVWNDLFPEVFNLCTLQKDYSDAPWMWHLFEFLRNHESLESIYSCFKTFETILCENWALS